MVRCCERGTGAPFGYHPKMWRYADLLNYLLSFACNFMNIRRISPHVLLVLLSVLVYDALGQAWIQTSAPESNWLSLACSADGSRLVAATCCPPAPTAEGLLYISTNAGTSWRICNSPPTNYTAVAMSADGMRLMASTFQGILFASSNGGDDWTTIVSPGSDLYCIAC